MAILTSLPAIVHVSTLNAESAEFRFTSVYAGYKTITVTTVTTEEYRFITKALAESTAAAISSDTLAVGASPIKYTRTLKVGNAQRAGQAGNYTCTKTTTVQAVYHPVAFDLTP
jgi:hypothetical protein